MRLIDADKLVLHLNDYALQGRYGRTTLLNTIMVIIMLL